MKKHNSSAEKRLLCAVIVLVGITNTISGGAVAVASIAKIDAVYLVGAAVVTTIFGVGLAWVGRGWVLELILNWSPAVKPKSNLKCGTWTIVIEFDGKDKPAKRERRTGGVDVFVSLTGIRITGRQLLDLNDCKTTTMNGWYAESIEMITYDGHDFLFYLYKIPLTGTADAREDEGKFEKIGFVWASRARGDNVFSGQFRDIRADKGIDYVREGTINLTYSESKAR